MIIIQRKTTQPEKYTEPNPSNWKDRRSYKSASKIMKTFFIVKQGKPEQKKYMYV